MFPDWPLIRQSMSKLTVNITFGPILNLNNFAKPPGLFVFYSEQPELLPMGIYSYLEFCHQLLLLKLKK